MRIARPILIFCLVTATTVMAFARPDSPPALSQADGSRVDWFDWLSDNGPSVVVFWASWLPDSQQDLNRLKDLQQAAGERDLGFVVVAVQERIEDSRKVLEDTGIPWLHDRHGEMLKHLLVFTVPFLAVVRDDGTVMARLSPEPKEIHRWNR